VQRDEVTEKGEGKSSSCAPRQKRGGGEEGEKGDKVRTGTAKLPSGGRPLLAWGGKRSWAEGTLTGTEERVNETIWKGAYRREVEAAVLLT